MEVESTLQQTQPKIEEVERADVVVAVLAEVGSDVVASLTEALRALPGPLRIAVTWKNSPAMLPRTHCAGSETGSCLTVVPWSVLGLDGSGSPLSSISAGYRSIFALSQTLDARACCIIASRLDTGALQRVPQFIQPLLEADFDLVAPHYARRKLQGLLNSGMVSPLMRSLYGKRIQNPMGPDLGVSRRLFRRILGTEPNARVSSRPIHPLASLGPIALCDNLRVCQVHLGARIYPPIDWTNVSSLLVELLGPLFLDMERNAPCWQRIRESIPVPSFGASFPESPQGGTVDVDRLVNSFQLGTRALQEIWSLVLPPTALFELRKLSRLSPDQFHMPDELWVRIVYDFALAHRLRIISRDHLLQSMTPLYLAWVASHAREVEGAEVAILEKQLERLSVAYETEKSYLVSRWRWPDRFNP